MKTYSQVKALEEKNKRRWLNVNDTLTEESGIYILYRSEGGIKYAYVGQAKHILTRLAQHLVGFQHIDLSLKKHGLATEKTYGWQVYAEHYDVSELDEKERYWIKVMADKGYQLRNKTLGGQNEGKAGLDNNKPSKGYYDGVAQGKRSLAKELRHIIDTHLDISVKKDTKVSQKALEKFYKLLESEEQ